MPVYIEHNGLRLNLTEWAKVTGLKKTTLWSRHRAGRPPDEVLAVTSYCERILEHGGKRLNLHGWSKLTGLSVPAISIRLSKGQSLEEVLCPGARKRGRPPGKRNRQKSTEPDSKTTP